MCCREWCGAVTACDVHVDSETMGWTVPWVDDQGREEDGRATGSELLAVSTGEHILEWDLFHFFKLLFRQSMLKVKRDNDLWGNNSTILWSVSATAAVLWARWWLGSSSFSSELFWQFVLWQGINHGTSINVLGYNYINHCHHFTVS